MYGTVPVREKFLKCTFMYLLLQQAKYFNKLKLAGYCRKHKKNEINNQVPTAWGCRYI